MSRIDSAKKRKKLELPKESNYLTNSTLESLLTPPSSSTPKKFQILRKLGACECVYDYEHSIGNVILTHVFKLKTKIDLIQNETHILQSIYKWKQRHALLRAKILTFKTDEKVCSSEKYFTVTNDDYDCLSKHNLWFYTINSDLNEQECLRLISDYSYNLPFIDSANDLLWRLGLVKFSSCCYFLVFTVHHAIVDARNVFSIIDELLGILVENTSSHYESASFRIEDSIEDKVLNSPMRKTPYDFNHGQEFTESCKIPLNFGHNKATETFIQVELISKSNKISISSIDKSITKTKQFCINSKQLECLLSKCKIHNTKLTGCLNMATILATRKLYNFFKSDPLLNRIQYHVLVNLRTYLSPALSNNSMGYFAVVFTSIFNEETQMNEETFWSDKFWFLAKQESDAIHNRIYNNEHFENAKHDIQLLEQINSDNKFSNANVHFAMSNLGVMNQSTKSLDTIKIDEHYFGTTCVQNRWSALVFHGITTVNDQLCWSISYNSECIRDEVIDYLSNFINEILNRILV